MNQRLVAASLAPRAALMSITSSNMFVPLTHRADNESILLRGGGASLLPACSALRVISALVFLHIFFLNIRQFYALFSLRFTVKLGGGRWPLLHPSSSVRDVDGVRYPLRAVRRWKWPLPRRHISVLRWSNWCDNLTFQSSSFLVYLETNSSHFHLRTTSKRSTRHRWVIYVR